MNITPAVYVRCNYSSILQLWFSPTTIEVRKWMSHSLLFEHLKQWANTVVDFQSRLTLFILTLFIWSIDIISTVVCSTTIARMSPDSHGWYRVMTWWRHHMETFSALLAICAGNSPVIGELHKGQWRGALMFSLKCAWINDWVNNGEAGDMRRHRAHYDVNVMDLSNSNSNSSIEIEYHVIYLCNPFGDRAVTDFISK